MTSPKLFEALMKEAVLQPILREHIEKSKTNPFFNRVLKEALLSDAAGALGKVHDTVIEAAKPAQIGRQMIWVLETQEALIRFPKAKKAKAYKTAELASVWITGEKYETLDVKADKEIKAGGEWSRRFIEDAKWPVLERQTAEVDRSIGQLETEEIINLYTGISASNLAGGAEVTAGTAGTLAYNDLVNAWGKVKAEDFNPTVLVISPSKAADLWKDEKFINSLYFGGQADKEQGIFGRSYFGFQIVISSLMPNNKALMIDTNVSAVMLLRRDIITEPYENPKEDRFGVAASERIGLGVLRSKAVSRIAI